MKIEGKNYKTIWFEDSKVKIIDQTKLPHKFLIKELKTCDDAVIAIKNMEVRGAPLIGATAAYGLVLSIIENDDLEPGTIVQELIPGYTLHDRLLRPAMVGVSKKPKKNDDIAENSSPEEVES